MGKGGVQKEEGKKMKEGKNLREKKGKDAALPGKEHEGREKVWLNFLSLETVCHFFSFTVCREMTFSVLCLGASQYLLK